MITVLRDPKTREITHQHMYGWTYLSVKAVDELRRNEVTNLDSFGIVEIKDMLLDVVNGVMCPNEARVKIGLRDGTIELKDMVSQR